MLVEEAAADDLAAFEPVEISPTPADITRLQKLLAAAERPLVIAGGSRWNENAVASLVRFAERFDVPVAVSFRRQMLFPNQHDHYAGDLGTGPNPKLAERVKNADLVLVFGARFSEWPSQGYTLLEAPNPGKSLVHVHAGIEELGRVYQPALAINATPVAFAAALEGLQPPKDIRWREWRKSARADYLAWSEEVPKHPGSAQMGTIVRWLREHLPADSILCNGAGNFSVWLHRFYRYPQFGTQLAPLSGSMGYGVPAAVAAKRIHPERTVMAFSGDGDFLMTGQELATAMQYGLAVRLFVIDNRHLRHHPHASGARISRPRVRHRFAKPGFRRLRPRLRRRRLHHRKRQGHGAGVGGRLRREDGIPHPRQARSRGDHAHDHAFGHSRQGDGRRLTSIVAVIKLKFSCHVRVTAPA